MSDVLNQAVAVLEARRDELLPARNKANMEVQEINVELRRIAGALTALTGKESKAGLVPPSKAKKSKAKKSRGSWGRGVRPSETTKARVRSFLMSKGNKSTHYQDIQEALKGVRAPGSVYQALQTNPMFQRTGWGEYRVDPTFTTEP